MQSRVVSPTKTDMVDAPQMLNSHQRLLFDSFSPLNTQPTPIISQQTLPNDEIDEVATLEEDAIVRELFGKSTRRISRPLKQDLLPELSVNPRQRFGQGKNTKSSHLVVGASPQCLRQQALSKTQNEYNLAVHQNAAWDAAFERALI